MRYSTDNTISSVHCKLHLRNGEVLVEDCSANGTYINGQKIGKGQTALVREDDSFSLLKPYSADLESPPYRYTITQLARGLRKQGLQSRHAVPGSGDTRRSALGRYMDV